MSKDQNFRKQELLNIWTHLFAVILFFVCSVYMVIMAAGTGKVYTAISSIVFGISLLVLYTSSVIYHRAKLLGHPKLNHFRMFDHISIYFLIAGSYTPYCLIQLIEGSGWRIFLTVWSLALAGTFFKLVSKGKFELLSLIIYIAIGLVIVLDYNELVNSTSDRTLHFILAGGAAYIIGTIFYASKKIPFSHPIWHLFVIAGSLFHYFGVLTIL